MSWTKRPTRSRRSKARRPDLAQHTFGFGLRPPAELMSEHALAQLILLQRRARTAGARVQTHQRPVNDLLERIDAQHPEGGLDRALDQPRVALEPQEPRQHRECGLVELRALLAQPVLEDRLVDGDPVEEIAAVQGRGPLE